MVLPAFLGQEDQRTVACFKNCAVNLIFEKTHAVVRKACRCVIGSSIIYNSFFFHMYLRHV